MKRSGYGSLLGLLHDEELRQRLGQQAARRVRRHYAGEKQVDSVIKVYDDVLRWHHTLEAKARVL